MKSKQSLKQEKRTVQKLLQTNDLWYNGLSYIHKISLTVLYYYPEVITLTLTKINLTVGGSVPSMKQKMYIL